MNPQEAYARGYQDRDTEVQHLRAQIEEAKTAIGPKLFVSGETFFDAVRRRDRIIKSVQLVGSGIMILPLIAALWWLADSLGEVNERCSKCFCPETSSASK